jgi:hypothetical protein
VLSSEQHWGHFWARGKVHCATPSLTIKPLPDRVVHDHFAASSFGASLELMDNNELHTMQVCLIIALYSYF